MKRWLHINLKDNSFYQIDCTKITHVYYGGMRSLTIFTANNQFSIEFCWEDCKGFNKYKGYAKEICDFIERGDEDGNIMVVTVGVSKNTIQVTKRDSRYNSINID